MQKSFYIKIISIIVSALFFTGSIAADISYADIASFRANNLQDRTLVSLKRGAAVIPGRLGFIDDEYTGSSGMKIFHIKDAHCNYDAQRSIYALIGWIAEKYGVDLVSLEGGKGRYDLSLLENIESPALKQSITDEYLRDGKITGAELYRVYNPEKIRLSGIEDEYLYEENLEIYKGLLEYRPRIDVFLDKADLIVERQSEKVINADLRAFLRQKGLFDRNQLGLDRYLPYLFRTANSLSCDLGDHPNSLLMTKLLLKEREIDFRAAKTERDKLVEDVLGRLSRYERGQVLSRIVMFKKGKMTESAIHGFLLDKAGETGLAPDSYPQLMLYWDYLLLYDRMEEARLFDEIDSMEERISASLCRTDEEKEILDIGAQTALLRDMFELRLGRDGLETAKKEIDVAEILFFIKRYVAGDEYGRLEEKAVYVSYGISRMMEFYAAADKRDDAFVRNVIAGMEENGVNASIIVTGGFHSDSLHGILREKGISFVSINPSFVNPQGYKNPYMRLLSGGADASSLELYSLFSSTIQLKSLWSEFGIDTDFAASFITRLNTAIEIAKRQEKDGIVIKLGDKSVMLLRAMGYEPAPNILEGYETRAEYSVIDASAIVGLSPGECIEKLSGLIGPDADYDPANGFAGNMHMADILRSLLSRYVDRGAEEEAASGTVRKNAYLRTYEGRIVQQKLKGMGDVDTFDYILDIQTGVLTCQFSCARTISGYMSEPSVIKGSNEKSYLCHQLRRIYRPGITPEEQKRILRELTDEQAEYESRGECGWQWVIDRDEAGELIVNDVMGYGLRSFRIFDRSKLPKGIEPQNLDADAEKYGSREMVQEMVFDITSMRQDKVRIKLINSWGAQEAAYTDPLTGLFNRRYFNLKIKPRMSRYDKATILFIDADHFKRFNDTYPGEHQFGDMILKAIAGVILRTVRGSDTVFRWGGEEFVVVLPEASGTQGKIVGRNILTNIKKLRPKGLRPADEISVTVGVTEIADTKDMSKIGEAVERSDKVMVDAKRRNMRGIVISFDEELPDYLKGAAAVAGATTAVSKDIIVRDLNDILGIYHPAMLENLREFLIAEKIGGTSQGEGLTRIFMDLQKDSINDKIEQLRAYQDVLQEGEKRPEDLEMAAFIARKHLRALYLTLSRIRERIYAVVGDSPATQRVRNAILNMEKAMDLMYKYLTEEDRSERELSPFGTPDGDSLMWLDRNGTIIWHPALQGETRELRVWNKRHEDWHRKLNKRYPEASKAAKEIAAIYLTYRTFEYVTDEHLESLLYAIMREYDFTPRESRHEKFIPGAAEYLRHAAVTIDLDGIEREALQITEEMLFREAGDKCIIFSKDNPEHAPAVEVMAYIAIKRPDLVRDSLAGLFRLVLKAKGAPDKTCVGVCKALQSIAKEHPEIITRGTVESIGILSRSGEYGSSVHEAAVGALATIVETNPRLMNEVFTELHPLYQIGIIERLLDLDGLIPGTMRDGDRKGIKTLCSYRVRQYIAGEKIPEWFLERVSSPDRSVPDLPLDHNGKPGITLEKFLSEPSAREVLRGKLSAKFINHIVEQIGTYEDLGIPALRGELTNVFLRMPEDLDASDGYSVERSANLAVLLGFEARDKMSDGETHAYYSVPNITHNITETILIHVLKECGLISPVGMSHFSQFISGRMPDEAKYVQIANVVLFPVKYDWNTWSTTDPVSGIPPIAYGRAEHADKTVFDVDYMDTSETTASEKEVVTYDEAMDYFAGMQMFKQFLSWAFQSSLVDPTERTETQGRLAVIWSDFRSRMEEILKDVGISDSLSAPVWISSEPMDGVDLNEYQWTYGSQQRRETIKEGLIELEKARWRSKELIDRTYALVSDSVKRVKDLIEQEAARKKELENTAREWSRALGGMMTLEKDRRETEAEFYKASGSDEIVGSVLERSEKLLGEEVSGDFAEKKLSDNAFSIVARTLQETHGVTKDPADKARYREKEDVRSADQWLSRMAARINRFPGEKRVIVYPVYSAMAYAKETMMASKLWHRFKDGDYGLDVLPIPYLAEDPASRERAINKMQGIFGEDGNARAMIYGDAGFFEENNEGLKTAYGGRVICVKEDGGAPYDDPAYISFYLRAALALTAIDYFDPRNDFKDEHKAKLEDMIAAFLALINGDKDVIETFKEKPARLINGIIVLKPAERISWEDVDEKMRASEQFVHSL